ncbi:MAG: cation:proton antiporter, partial [Anaerolineales bacterium]|nr:cation:proton antiporter [Anaerolineales bacterium]
LTPFLQFLLLITVILVVAKAAGYLSTLLRQPSVLGELIVGVFLGPSLVDILHIAPFDDHLLNEIIHDLAEMGVLLLMFVAGLELHFSDLAKNGKVAALAGSLGVVIPVGFGWIVGTLFGYAWTQSLFLGLTLGATSVSISAQTLMEMKVLRSRVGLSLLGAAVFDDVLVILLLSTFLAFLQGSAGAAAVVMVFVRMVVFLGASVAFGWRLLPWMVRKVARLPISQGVITLALVVTFSYALAAELVGGMAAITGAFLAGLFFARSPEKERLERGIGTLAYGFFVPVFFVSIGLSVNARALDASVIWLAIAIIIIAVIGKWGGAGIGARLGGLSWLESTQLGAGMISRGEVGLILASVGQAEGLVSSGEFSAVVAMVLVSTLITPPILRALFKKQSHPVTKTDLAGETKEAA